MSSCLVTRGENGGCDDGPCGCDAPSDCGDGSPHVCGHPGAGHPLAFAQQSPTAESQPSARCRPASRAHRERGDDETRAICGFAICGPQSTDRSQGPRGSQDHPACDDCGKGNGCVNGDGCASGVCDGVHLHQILASQTCVPPTVPAGAPRPRRTQHQVQGCPPRLQSPNRTGHPHPHSKRRISEVYLGSTTTFCFLR